MDRQLVNEVAAELKAALVAEAEKNREQRRAEANLERARLRALDLDVLGAAKSASLQKAVAAAVETDEKVVEHRDIEIDARHDSEVATADVRAAEAKIRLHATESPAVTNYALPETEPTVPETAQSARFEQARQTILETPQLVDLCGTCTKALDWCPWEASFVRANSSIGNQSNPGRPKWCIVTLECLGYVPPGNADEILQDALAAAREEIAQEAMNHDAQQVTKWVIEESAGGRQDEEAGEPGGAP